MMTRGMRLGAAAIIGLGASLGTFSSIAAASLVAVELTKRTVRKVIAVREASAAIRVLPPP